jgi:hypothetical protein
MVLTVYIKSGGTYPEHGYRWSDRNNEIISTPESLQEIQELIQSDARSIVLQQKETSLLLLVTGIESNRKDIQGRTIRNSIAWIGNDPDCETDRQTLQQIAACALKNELDNRINSSIIEEGGNFKVLWEQIDQIEKDFTRDLSWDWYPDPAYKIGKNTDELRQDLAEELETANFEENFLVIVTGNKSEETLKKAGVWRGLSNLIPYEEWQEYEPNQKLELNEQQNLENFVEDVGEVVEDVGQFFEGVRKEFDKFIAQNRKRNRNRRYKDRR